MKANKMRRDLNETGFLEHIKLLSDIKKFAFFKFLSANTKRNGCYSS